MSPRGGDIGEGFIGWIAIALICAVVGLILASPDQKCYGLLYQSRLR